MPEERLDRIIPQSQPPTTSSKLKREEQRIDLKVLHHKHLDDNRKKQKRFARTVLAVHAIVSQKLYKTKANSLEAYFRDAWKISRAQVYRFLDCAVILKQLESFSEQPCRERLCRSLKSVAKNRADIHLLWKTVLAKVNNEHESVTSTIINNVWRELLDAKLVTGDPPTRDERVEIEAEVGGLSDFETEVVGGFGDDYDSDQAEMDAEHPKEFTRGEFRSEQAAANVNSSIASYAYRPSSQLLADGNGIAYVPPSNAVTSPSSAHLIPGSQQNVAPGANTHPEDIVSACLSLVNSLESHGYSLQPLVNGRWLSDAVTQWRIVPQSDFRKGDRQGGARRLSESYDDYSVSGSPHTREARQEQPFSVTAPTYFGPGHYMPHQSSHLGRPSSAAGGFQPPPLYSDWSRFPAARPPSQYDRFGTPPPYPPGTGGSYQPLVGFGPPQQPHQHQAQASHSKATGLEPLHPLHVPGQPHPRPPSPALPSPTDGYLYANPVIPPVGPDKHWSGPQSFEASQLSPPGHPQAQARISSQHYYQSLYSRLGSDSDPATSNRPSM
ncbi:hypothetical protein HDU86_003291 [Geranomyces michiganensis]|nr:hypothetical protein HDU86_003291 [Geranomyces michiganensis]